MKFVWFVTDISFAVILVLAMNVRLAWGLNLGELELLGVMGATVFGLARIPISWNKSRGFAGWLFLVPAWVIVTAGLWVVTRWLSHPLSGLAIVYLSSAVVGQGVVFRLLHRSLSSGENDWQEYLRILSLVLGAGWLFYPFFTSQFVGGMDARWYGYVMADALEQARAGVFPVFIGQGEYMYNGAVHPYRTAPYYHNLGIAIDLATGRILTALAVQHVVVIVTAALAALVSYVCFVLLAPGRRWLAWLLALLYVSGPVLALYIYASEMYMTYTALAWLPLVLSEIETK